MAVNFLGVGSGLDLQSMLDQMVSLTLEPKVELLGSKEVEVKANLSGVGSIKSVLSEFQDAVEALKSTGLYGGMAAVIEEGDADKSISVSADDNAAVGDYQVEVLSLATGSRYEATTKRFGIESVAQSDSVSPLGIAGNLTFDVAGESFSVGIAAGDSLDDIASNINASYTVASPSYEVSVKVVDNKLVIQSSDDALKVSNDNEDLNIFSTEQTGSSIPTMSGELDSAYGYGAQGKLVLSAGDSSFEVAVGASDSMEDIINSINTSSDNFGVSATIVDGIIVYKSSVTGSNNGLTVTTAADDITDPMSPVAANAWLNDFSTASLIEKQAAQDSQIKVDGITLSSESNTFTGQVTGLTFEAKEAGLGVATFSVSKDTAAVTNAVTKLANKYNAVIDTVKGLNGSTNDDGDFEAGPMFGSSLLRQIQSTMSDAVSGVVGSGTDGLNSMWWLGFNLDEDGKIDLDSSKLSESVSNNFNEISDFFAADNGFATSLYDRLDGFLSFDGVLDQAEKNYQDKIDDINDQYEDHISYVESYKKTLVKQFAALDSTIAQLNATMSYVSSQLSQLQS